MLLTAKNLDQVKFNTKRVKLTKADAEINIALIPVDLMDEAKNTGDQEAVGIRIITTSVVDDNRDPVFTPQTFKTLPVALQNEIMDAVCEYNGLLSPDKLEKN